MNITQIVTVMVCVVAVGFLLRVLRALIQEKENRSSHAVEVYFAKFIPPQKQGELIVMNPEARKRKFPDEARRAAFVLVAILLLLPGAHAQDQSQSQPPAASAKEVQELRDLVKQLEEKVDRLESEQQKSAGSQPNTTPPTGASSKEETPAAQSTSTANKQQPPTAEAAVSTDNGMVPEKQTKPEPFNFADWTWMNGNARTKDTPYDTKYFTPEIRFDAGYIYDLNHPADDTIGGSAEVFRAQEFQLTQLGVGGNFHWDNVRGRLMTQFGMYSQTQPRNDASPARGQWNLSDAYRYLAEAYGGYHFDVSHGLNVDAGIFMSYIGLFSWYNFDNWAYQPSYVSSNTPFFFNGLRVQWFPTEKLKIEPWLINGWQSYGRFNGRPGLGFQVLYRPNAWLSFVSNGYGVGADTLGTPGRIRYHSDNSLEIKYYDHPERALDKMAFSLTGDIGCEHGGGVSCAGDSAKGPKQDFLGYMLYNRFWFHKDRYGFTIGGGQINNPGRYLVLLPPINGATAITGTPYFTENPGNPFKASDVSETFDYMPSQYITFRWEFDHRQANVPYFSGSRGITPPSGNNGNPGATVPGWSPDLVTNENRFDLSILVKF